MVAAGEYLSNAENQEDFVAFFSEDLSDLDKQKAELQKLEVELQQNTERYTVAIESSMVSAINWAAARPEEAQAWARRCSTPLQNCTLPNKFTAGQNFSSIISVGTSQFDMSSSVAVVRDNVESLMELQSLYLKAFERLLWAVLCVSPLCALVGTWFVYVSFRAYRKGILELAFSSPLYRFHPLWQNCASDKKFVGIYTSCMLLGYLMLTIVLVLVVFMLTWEKLWRALGDYIHAIIALATYYVFSLVLIPLFHGWAVMQEGTLARPRLQAILMFVFELWYLPQCVSSALCHLGVVVFAAICMFLRPDRNFMPWGLEWLDFLHFAYASMQYEQLHAAMNKFSEGSSSV